MPKHDVTDLISSRLGNHTRSNVLQQLHLPGLSIDNVPSSPNVSEGTNSSASSSVTQQTAELSKQLNDLRTSQQSQIEKLLENTQALVGNTTSKSGTKTGSVGAGSTIESLASSLLTGGGGLGSIVEGILGLFGGAATTASPLVPFSLPSSISYAGSQTANGGVTAADYGQNGQLRPVAGTQTGAANGGQSAMVQIQVNAMDSQSFLDHSEDIAQAVRRALLNSSSLKDVIAEI